MNNIKELKAQYEQDVANYGREKANSMWQHNDYGGCWTTFYTTEVPIWYTNVEYRRKPQGHKHAALMAQYAEDAKTTDKPWELWEFKYGAEGWKDCSGSPFWASEVEYRRKPKQHTIVLTTEQLKEVILACAHPDCYNHVILSAEQILRAALENER
jgi:hypothetical protein